MYQVLVVPLWYFASVFLVLYPYHILTSNAMDIKAMTTSCLLVAAGLAIIEFAISLINIHLSWAVTNILFGAAALFGW